MSEKVRLPARGLTLYKKVAEAGAVWLGSEAWRGASEEAVVRAG